MPQMPTIRSWSLLSRLQIVFWASLFLGLVLTTEPVSSLEVFQGRFTFEDADIRIVIAEVARRTGVTFVFDPARVKGRITVLAAGDVTPARALELLRSALALHGYALLSRPEGMWIVPAHEVASAEFVVRVVPLTYADAGDVAYTLSWVAPPGVRIVPFYPTNSVVISGHATAVDQMVDVMRRR